MCACGRRFLVTVTLILTLTTSIVRDAGLQEGTVFKEHTQIIQIGA